MELKTRRPNCMESELPTFKHNVAITGLTAAGKTTHSHITIKEFGFGYVSASTILREKAGLTGEPSADFWLSPKGQALTQKIIELGIDEALRDKEEASEFTIFDCRSLPWLTRRPILSIWLESSLESRVYKAIVSHGESEKRSFDEIRREIAAKDERDRGNLLRAFGFDLLNDWEPLDVVIDISDFIEAPSCKASWKSIQLAQDIISVVVGLYLDDDDFYRIRLNKLRKIFGHSIFKHFSKRYLQILDN